MSGEMQYTFSLKKLGLAAYIIMRGGTVLGKSKKEGFKVSTSRPKAEWAVEYANSCCAKHDQTLMSLRNMTEE